MLPRILYVSMYFFGIHNWPTLTGDVGFKPLSLLLFLKESELLLFSFPLTLLCHSNISHQGHRINLPTSAGRNEQIVKATARAITIFGCVYLCVLVSLFKGSFPLAFFNLAWYVRLP